MHQRLDFDVALLWKAIAGALVGIGIGTVASGDPIALPAVGSAPAVTAGAAVVLLGIGLLRVGPRADCESGDDCSGDGSCGC